MDLTLVPSPSNLSKLAFGALALFAASACDLSGGANRNQSSPGNMDQGVDLGQGNIAVHPRSGSFIARVEGGGTIHGHVDGSWKEVDLDFPERLAFAPRRDLVYVASQSGGGTLVAYDLKQDEPLWQANSSLAAAPEVDWAIEESNWPWLQVSDDDEHLVVIERQRLEVRSTSDGARLGGWTAPSEIVDVDLSHDGTKAYVVTDGAEPMQTRFFTLSVPDMERTAISVPNCAAPLAIEPRGKYGFMAPTRCNADPVSVIDLEQGEFVRNLPGFGPVALAGKGRLGVAFVDLADLDESLFLDTDPRPEGDRRYHLMLIDTQTLEFEFAELGDTLPRYAPTPDGKLLLLDHDSWYEDEQVRLFDIESKTFETLVGPAVQLDAFVITQDSKRAFALDRGVFELDFAEAIVSSLPLALVPSSLNITPDDTMLLMREELGPIHVYDIEARRVVRALGPAVDGAPTRN
jgi:hypothetical protein